MDIRSTGNVVQTPASFTSNGLPVANGPTLPVKSVTLPTQLVAAIQQPAPEGTAEEVGEAVKKINTALQTISQDLQFSVDTDSDRTIVKVIDSRTQELIRQMPTQEALEIAKALDRAMGMLIRQKA